MNVIIVTRPDLGWDSVVAVVSGDNEIEDVRRVFPGTEYVISYKTIDSLEEWSEY